MTLIRQDLGGPLSTQSHGLSPFAKHLLDFHFTFFTTHTLTENDCQVFKVSSPPSLDFSRSRIGRSRRHVACPGQRGKRWTGEDPANGLQRELDSPSYYSPLFNSSLIIIHCLYILRNWLLVPVCTCPAWHKQTWNAYECDIHEDKIRQTADIMVSKGRQAPN